jgi:hypothetical protein
VPADALGARPVAKARELALLRSVEHVDAGKTFERLQDRRELVRRFVAAPAVVAAADDPGRRSPSCVAPL